MASQDHIGPADALKAASVEADDLTRQKSDHQPPTVIASHASHATHVRPLRNAQNFEQTSLASVIHQLRRLDDRASALSTSPDSIVVRAGTPPSAIYSTDETVQTGLGRLSLGRSAVGMTVNPPAPLGDGPPVTQPQQISPQQQISQPAPQITGTAKFNFRKRSAPSETSLPKTKVLQTQTLRDTAAATLSSPSAVAFEPKIEPLNAADPYMTAQERNWKQPGSTQGTPIAPVHELDPLADKVTSCAGSTAASTSSDSVLETSGTPDPRPVAMLLQPQFTPGPSGDLVVELEKLYKEMIVEEQRLILSVDQIYKGIKVRHEWGSGHWAKLKHNHNALLCRYFDYLHISQLPSAPDSVKAHGARRKLPSRVWENGMHRYIELLRTAAPVYGDIVSEFLLDHILLSYRFLTLFLETLPAFEAEWLEALGNISRYKMSLEPAEPQFRMIALNWFGKASASNPSLGRLYHHQGVLARPNPLATLFYYSKALICTDPYTNARKTMDSVFKDAQSFVAQPGSAHLASDVAFAGIHHALLHDAHDEKIRSDIRDYSVRLHGRIGSAQAGWKYQGVFIAVANITALMQYGKASNPFLRLFADAAKSKPKPEDFAPCPWLDTAVSLITSVMRVALGRVTQTGSLDTNVLPHLHVVLVFFHALLLCSPDAHSPLGVLVRSLPWNSTAEALNKLDMSECEVPRKDDPRSTVSLSSDAALKPLPEDFLARGVIWWKFGHDPARSTVQDDDLQLFELETSERPRIARLLQLGISIATTFSKQGEPGLAYDKYMRRFAAPRSSSSQVSTDSKIRRSDLPPSSAAQQKVERHQPQKPTERDVQIADIDTPINFEVS